MKITKKGPGELTFELEPGEYWGLSCENCKNPVQVRPRNEGIELYGEGNHFKVRCPKCQHWCYGQFTYLDVFRFSE
jgi:hypothetical protein